jgi:glycosyltransferase involved in cell wall biosynthesis
MLNSEIAMAMPKSVLLQANKSDRSTARLERDLKTLGYRVTIFPNQEGLDPPRLRSPPDIYMFHGAGCDVKNAPGRLNVFFLADEYPDQARLNAYFDLVIVPSQRTKEACRRKGISIPVHVVSHGIGTVLDRAWAAATTALPPRTSPSAEMVAYCYSVKGRVSWQRANLEIDRLLRKRYRRYQPVSYAQPLPNSPSNLLIGQSEYCLEGFLRAAALNPMVRRILHQEGTALERRIAITNSERRLCGVPLIEKRPIEIWRNRMECDLADHILVASRAAGKYFLNAGYPQKKVRVLPWGIDLRRRVKRRASAKLRFLFAGTEPFRKGIRMLLEAWDALRPAGAELWCFTSQEIFQSKKLLRYVVSNPSIMVKPLVPHRVFQRLLPEVDCQVLPSLEDSFSFVIGDGMGCAVPAIVSDETGISDLITHQESGLIVKTGSAEQLMAALDSCCNNLRQLRNMGEGAYEAARLYPWERFRGEFAALADSCLKVQ